jgi:hypothetical protein
MTPDLPDEAVEAAIIAGCNAADIHLVCSYPDCQCKNTPAIVRHALRAAEDFRKAERKRAHESMMAPEVEDSCGCVFCDMDLTPVEHEGKLQHHVRVSKRLRKTPPPESWVPCTKGETP